MSIIALFYAGYGANMIPSFGIIDAYGGYTSEYYNAFGFFILCETYSVLTRELVRV